MEFSRDNNQNCSNAKYLYNLLIAVINMIDSENQGFDNYEEAKDQLAFNNESNVSQPQQIYKSKVLFRKPYCIYSQIPLYIYHKHLNEIPNELTTSEGKYQPNPHPYLFNNEQKIEQKFMKMYFSKKMNNYFNKFNENLFTKNEMTLYLKKINKVTKTAILNTFEIPIQEEQKRLRYGRALSFESSFESGNLHSVFNNHKQPNTYYLFLQNDTNTHGYNQWFHFLVKPIFNEKRLQKNKRWKYRFLIVNLSKDIKYIQKMKLLTCCEKSGWECQVPFSYYKNRFQKNTSKIMSTIDFQFQFIPDLHENGVYFSLIYPYTYTKLMNFLSSIKKEPLLKILDIGKSEGSNSIYLLQLRKNNSNSLMKSSFFNGSQGKLRHSQGELRSSKTTTRSQAKIQNTLKNKSIIILSRQHPSETASSFVCEFIIRELLFNKKYGLLLSQIDWFIFPMTNPDGVIHGHSRTNLKGYDINRCWSKQNLLLSKEVEIINSSIQEIISSYDVEYIIDLHSHAKQLGCFGYFSYKDEFSNIFNFLMKEKCEFYKYNKSKFGLAHNKRPTFRGQMFHRNAVKKSITIQVSFYGYEKDENIYRFSEKDYKHISQAILDTFLELTALSRDRKNKIINNVKSLDTIYQKQKKQQSKFLEVQNSDSDSNPEGQYLRQAQRKQLNEKGNITSLSEIQMKKQKSEESDQSKTKSFTKIEYVKLKKKKIYNQQRKKPIYTSHNINFQAQIKNNLSQFVEEKKDSEDKLYNEINISDRLQKNQMSNLKNKRYSKFEVKKTTNYPTASNIRINMIEAKSNQSTFHEGFHSTQSRKLIKSTHRSFNSTKQIPKAFEDKNWVKKFIKVKRIYSLSNIKR